MTKKTFISAWNDMDDEMRCRWLAKISDSKNIPEHKIEIDNDNVYITFNDEDDMPDNEMTDEDRTVLYFDNYGYHSLIFLFKSMGIRNVDFV